MLHPPISPPSEKPVGPAVGRSRLGRGVSRPDRIDDLDSTINTSGYPVLTWSDPAGATEVAVFRDGVEIAQVAPGTQTYEDTTATEGTTPVYDVRGRSGEGVLAVRSNRVSVGPLDYTPPPAVQAVTATYSGQLEILVEWTPPADESDVVNYRVVISDQASADSATFNTGAAGANELAIDPQVFPELTEGATYDVDVTSVDAVGFTSVAVSDSVFVDPPAPLDYAVDVSDDYITSGSSTTFTPDRVLSDPGTLTVQRVTEFGEVLEEYTSSEGTQPSVTIAPPEGTNFFQYFWTRTLDGVVVNSLETQNDEPDRVDVSFGPPAFASGPTIDTQATTQAQLRATYRTDQQGTVYAVLLPSGDPTPGAQDVYDEATGASSALGALQTDVQPGDPQQQSATTYSALTAATTYDLHFVARNDFGELSAVASLAASTDAPSFVPTADSTDITADSTSLTADTTP